MKTKEEIQSLKQIERDVQNLRGQFENPAAELHHMIESCQALETEVAWFRRLLHQRLHGVVSK